MSGYTVIDKRRYRPLCIACRDEGCGLCESNRATAYSVRLERQDAEQLKSEVLQFVRGLPRFPQNEVELLSVVYQAMVYSLDRERRKHDQIPVDVYVPTEERFRRLDID